MSFLPVLILPNNYCFLILELFFYSFQFLLIPSSGFQITSPIFINIPISFFALKIPPYPKLFSVKIPKACYVSDSSTPSRGEARMSSRQLESDNRQRQPKVKSLACQGSTPYKGSSLYKPLTVHSKWLIIGRFSTMKKN